MGVNSRRSETTDSQPSEDVVIDDIPWYRRVGDGPLCACVPYDAFVITAQIASIAAFLLSCLSWVSFLLGLAGFLPFQALWCRRQRKKNLWILATIAGLCSLSSFALGLALSLSEAAASAAATVVCTPDNPLYAFVLDQYGADAATDEEHRCPEGLWVGLSFLCGVLWTLSSLCIVYFVRSGRYDRFEELHDDRNRNRYGRGDPRNRSRSNDSIIIHHRRSRNSRPVAKLGTISEHSFSESLSELSVACCSV